MGQKDMEKPGDCQAFLRHYRSDNYPATCDWKNVILLQLSNGLILNAYITGCLLPRHGRALYMRHPLYATFTSTI